ncbi:MAG: hypothetical protein ABSF03_07505 [Streptosporangiaceae bacterium]|jgi:hypothetical protein
MATAVAMGTEPGPRGEPAARGEDTVPGSGSPGTERAGRGPGRRQVLAGVAAVSAAALGGTADDGVGRRSAAGEGLDVQQLAAGESEGSARTGPRGRGR